jgi:hypothetical protein
MKLTGRVVRQPFGVGSKSERQAVVLRTTNGTYVLRRKGAAAFGDPALDALVGRHILAEGTLTGYTFLMSSCEDLDD